MGDSMVGGQALLAFIPMYHRVVSHVFSKDLPPPRHGSKQIFLNFGLVPWLCNPKNLRTGET